MSTGKVIQIIGAVIDVEFEKDNIPVKYKIENTLDCNTDTGMLKSLFLFGLSLVDILKNENSKYRFVWNRECWFFVHGPSYKK